MTETRREPHHNHQRNSERRLPRVPGIRALLPVVCTAALWAIPAAWGAAPAASANAVQAPVTSALPAPKIDAAFVVPPYLQDLRTDAVTVMWWSANPSYGWVEYGESKSLGKKADTVIDGLREVDVRRHAVHLSGLKPGARYWYRTGMRSVAQYTKNYVRWGADVCSPVYSFTTPSPQDTRVRCVIHCDTHTNTNIAPLMALPDAKSFDFSIFNGDCFANIKTESSALGLLRAYTEAVDGASRPAVFVRGNHELRFAYATHLRHLFTYPEDHPYFAFTRGPVRFVVLDCGEAVRDAHRMCGGTLDCSSMRAEVRDWLAREIASVDFKKPTWHVLIHHIPLYGPGCSEHSKPFYLPVLAKATFDLSINGHIHASALLKRGAAGNPYPVVTGGAFSTAMTVFEATATNWNVKVIDNTGKVLVEERGGQ